MKQLFKLSLALLWIALNAYLQFGVFNLIVQFMADRKHEVLGCAAIVYSIIGCGAIALFPALLLIDPMNPLGHQEEMPEPQRRPMV